MPGKSVTDKSDPISKAKLPIGADEYHAINERFGFWGNQVPATMPFITTAT